MRRAIDNGTVYLVGAGPGDPDLITVRGLKVLRLADVVLYDRLVHADLLEEVRPDAERIYVGKAPGNHTLSQGSINDLLVERARRGLLVVRLKGGDPFVFGRGGEEAMALAAAGISFQVVPGISSALSVPAYAGIPVTHRHISSAFTVVTGHACHAGDDPDWVALARAGTLVILMGLRRLPAIAATLIEAGIDASTPAAVISSGATENQAVVEGTLEDIGRRTRHLSSPATIVIGQVVGLRSWLSWFESPARSGGDGVPYSPAWTALFATAGSADVSAARGAHAGVASRHGSGATEERRKPTGTAERSEPIEQLETPEQREPIEPLETAERPKPIERLVAAKRPKPIEPLETAERPKPGAPLVTAKRPKPIEPLVTAERPKPGAPLVTAERPKPGAPLVTAERPKPVEPALAP